MFRRIVRSQLFVRAVGTLLYGSVFVWVVLAGGIPLFVGITVVTAAAAYEFYRLMAKGGHRPLWLLGVLTALLFVCSAYFEIAVLGPGLVAALVLSVLWLGIEQARRGPSEAGPGRNVILDWTLTFAGAIYTGGLLSHALLLRSVDMGGPFLATVLFGTAACDTGAYLIGSNLGRTKIFPRISPNKTWEGTIGGFLLSVAVVMVSATFYDIQLLYALGMGVLIAVSVILGDLMESKIKRSVSVKDSGSWIPAQGGILDVIDGFLLAVAVSYYYVALMAWLA